MHRQQQDNKYSTDRNQIYLCHIGRDRIHQIVSGNTLTCKIPLIWVIIPRNFTNTLYKCECLIALVWHIDGDHHSGIGIGAKLVVNILIQIAFRNFGPHRIDIGKNTLYTIKLMKCIGKLLLALLVFLWNHQYIGVTLSKCILNFLSVCTKLCRRSENMGRTIVKAVCIRCKIRWHNGNHKQAYKWKHEFLHQLSNTSKGRQKRTMFCLIDHRIKCQNQNWHENKYANQADRNSFCKRTAKVRSDLKLH